MADNCDKIDMIKLADLVPYIRNAKKHDKTQIDNVAQSIKEFGIVQPIVVDKDNNIIIGHCRALACKKLNIKEVPVVKLEDLTPEEANKLRLLDNKLNESAWDFDLLADDVPELDFSAYDIDWQLPEIIEEGADVIEDDVPEEVETRCKLGDIWQLGAHRLICGDSTDITVIDKLMDGAKADLLLTDPPYNVALGQSGGHALRPSEAKQLHRRTDGLTIENDSWKNEEEFINFLTSAFNVALSVMRAGACFYIWYADTQSLNFRLACKNAGMQIRENLIWNKSTFALGRQDYQWKHEPCLYGWKDGASHLWASDRKQSTVIDFEKPNKSELHPTMKPIGLIAYQVGNNTHEGDAVLDLFGGSGSTLIACEQLNRKCYMCELDPHYCDVIIQRWENFTGEKAIKDE